ncbi:MAG: glycosyltransferase [Clostridiales bacterium]|nr:glycosyltransferase [Clostridiales bacterium]
MKKKLKVLFVTAESAPYAQVGGLGEVSYALPQALFNNDVEVRRVMPLYKEYKGRTRYIKDFPVPTEDGKFESCIVKTDPDNKEVPSWFISNHRYFYRDSIYSQEDDGFRFFFFCRAVVEMLKLSSWKPNVIHLNDWHTAFLALLVKRELPEIKTVFTIHNISYDGFIPPSFLDGILSDREKLSLGWPDWLSFMKAGILYADKLTTVSPTYSMEIQQVGSGNQMQPYLQQRQDKITGILNGIDWISYSPKDDGVQPYSFDNKSWKVNKKKNRSALREELNLPDMDIPLISMISRLQTEKGIDLVIKAFQKLNWESFQIIIMGSGNLYYEGLLSSLSSEYPENVVFLPEYSHDLARKIYGASDIYLMPSQYEPCGIGQLYAMRYGAVPVVNPVGGLRDTVVDAGHTSKDRSMDVVRRKTTGFYLEEWTDKSLVSALERAINTYNTSTWTSYVNNCMRYNSSWQQRVDDYIFLYRQLMEKPIEKQENQ